MEKQENIISQRKKEKKMFIEGKIVQCSQILLLTQVKCELNFSRDLEKSVIISLKKKLFPWIRYGVTRETKEFENLVENEDIDAT